MRKICSELKPEDKDRRLLIEIWDWDRTSRNDFMGSLSFGISELLKSPADGWFKLLTQEEGEFYNVPVPEEGVDMAQIKSQMRVPMFEALRIIHKLMRCLQKTSITKKPSLVADKDVPHNMGKKDVIRASDFNFLMVLGKGSFGKVNLGRNISNLSLVKLSTPHKTKRVFICFASYGLNLNILISVT